MIQHTICPIVFSNLLFLFFLSLISPSQSLLRLCNPNEEFDCVLNVSRMELRQLDKDQRAHLLHAFRHEKTQHNRKEWERILEGEMAYDLIRRLDDRLSVEGFFTPFWDSKMDRRIENPSDSIIFLDDFLPRARGRREKPRIGEKKRVLSSHPLRQFKKTKHSQLLYVLHEIGNAYEMSPDSCTMCPSDSEWLFCDESTNSCVTKISPIGNCSRFSSHSAVCYDSECVDGVCTVSLSNHPQTTVTLPTKVVPTPILREVPREKGNEKRRKNKRKLQTTTPEPFNNPVQSIIDEWNEAKVGVGYSTPLEPFPTPSELVLEKSEEGSGQSIDKLIEEVDQLIAEVETTVSDERVHSTEERADGKKSRSFRTLSVQTLDGELINEDSKYTDNTDKKQRIFYRLEEESSSTVSPPLLITSKPSTVFDEDDDFVPSALREESSTPYFTNVLVNRVPIETRNKIEENNGEKMAQYLPKGVIEWGKETPFPLSYFTITVIQGGYRRHANEQKEAKSVIVYTTGANMPSGYTQSIQGSSVNGTTIVRVLDPSVSGILTEFNVTVVDSRGKLCEQQCQSATRKGHFKGCPSEIVRLSPLAQFSDDITLFKTAEEAVNGQWFGRGYFRKKRNDHLLFKCDNYKKKKRHHQNRRNLQT